MITHPNVKVNLGLNVLRRREDGFHDIETLFVPYMDISDTLEIITGDDYSRTSASIFARYGNEVCQAISDDGRLMITVARSQGVDWDPLDDLCARAYFILSEDFRLPPVKIFLEKLSPVGAGLGGGSSDAAFALRMMNEMFGLGLDSQGLASYAARLGSDCAFFIYNRPMFGTGRGEILEPYELNDRISFGEGDDGDYELKVVVPDNLAVSTAEAYMGITPELPDIPLRTVLSMPVEQWKDMLRNDFEKTVFKAHPELSAIRDSLYSSGAVYAAMSGSGSALFAIYRR